MMTSFFRTCLCLPTKKTITKMFRFREMMSIQRNQSGEDFVKQIIKFDWLNSKIPDVGFDLKMVTKIFDRLFCHDA